MKHTLFPLLAASAVVLASSANAAISITNDAFTYSQNFNSLASSGTGNTWTNNSTIAGWHLYQSAGNAITAYDASTGTSNTGSFFSYGPDATDRALGGLGSGGTYFGSPASGAVAGHIAVAFTNNTSETLEAIDFSFNGEQWRKGGETTAQTMVLEYGFGSTFTAVTTWTAPGGTFNWASPINTATGAAVDGNVAGLVTGRGGEIDSLTWTAGSTMWLRWIERNDAGSDHGLAIDSFSVNSVTAVPEPTAAVLGSLGLLGLLRRRR